MKKQTFTQAGTNRNEDTVFVNDYFGFVIDGATGLAGKTISPCQSDAQWFAYALRDYLVNALHSPQDIRTILADVLTNVNNDFNTFDGAENVPIKPSAGIAIYRIVGDFVEYFVLGDCSILFKTNEGNIIHYHSTDLEPLDKANIKLMQKRAIENNIDVVDAFPLIMEELQYVRNLKNKENGYYILSDNIDAVNHGIHGIIEKNKIQDILLTTDGFSQIFDLFKAYNKAELFEALKTKNLEDIYAELYALQEQDKKCNNHPRFKTRDDATAAHIKF